MTPDLLLLRHNPGATDRVDEFKLAAQRLLAVSGDQPNREGLQRTPQRFAKAMTHFLSGYQADVESTIGEGVFAAEGNGLVTVANVEFYSLCEHHLLPFWGQASVAYYPDRKIIGLSKIPRLVDLFARRMQVQERLTKQIVDALWQAVEPRAVVVRTRASHLCMMMRGVEKQQSQTIAEAQRGLETLSPLELERVWSAL